MPCGPTPPTRSRDAGWTRWPRARLFANAFSEKGTLAVGSLVFNTRLLPDGDGAFRLDGEKFYSTGTLFSDYLTVATTTDHDSVASVIVPTDRTGVRLIDDWDGFGQRRTGTGTTVFTDVAVSADEVLADTPYDAEPDSHRAVRRRCSCTSTRWSPVCSRRSSTTGWPCCGPGPAASATR